MASHESISIDTCISVVLQIYTRDSYSIMLKVYCNTAFKFVNAKGVLFLFQVLAGTVLIPQIFDDFSIRKGILNILFGNIFFKNNIVTLLIDSTKIF